MDSFGMLWYTGTLYMYYIVTVFVGLTPLCYLELKTFEIP